MSFPKSLNELREDSDAEIVLGPATDTVKFEERELGTGKPLDTQECGENCLAVYQALKKEASGALHARNRAIRKANKLLERLRAAESAVLDDDEDWKEVGREIQKMELEMGVPRKQGFFALPGILNKTSIHYHGLDTATATKSNCNPWATFTAGMVAGGVIVLSLGGLMWKCYQYCYPSTVVPLNTKSLEMFPGRLELQKYNQETQTNTSSLAVRGAIGEEGDIKVDREIARDLQDKEHMEAAMAESKEMERDRRIITYSKQKFMEAVEMHLPEMVKAENRNVLEALRLYLPDMVKAVMEDEILAGRGDQTASSHQLDSSSHTEYQEVSRYHDVPKHQSTPTNAGLPPPPPDMLGRTTQDTVPYSNTWVEPRQRGSNEADSFSLSSQVTFPQLGRKGKEDDKGE